MGWLDSFFHPEKAYEKGQEQLDKYYNKGQEYLSPYNQFGQDAHGDLSGVMKRLLDPAALEGEWVNSYHESPTAVQAEKMAQQHGLDAASSLGLNGSNTALQAIQGGTSRIGMEDRQSYLGNLMQKYLAGAGIAGNIFNTGANTAGAMSNNALNMGNNSAQMQYGAQSAPGALFGKLLGTGIGVRTGAIGQNGSGMPSWSLGG